MDLIYGSVFSSSRNGGLWKIGWMGCIVTLASSDFYLIRVYENLVQHPSNNISIPKTIRQYKYVVNMYKFFIVTAL